MPKLSNDLSLTKNTRLNSLGPSKIRAFDEKASQSHSEPPYKEPEQIYHAVILVEFDIKFGDIEAKDEWKKDIEKSDGRIKEVPVWEKIKNI